LEKLLIAGGFGFVGKNLIELLKNKYSIVVIDKYIDQNFIRSNPEIAWYQYDFQDIDILKNILNKEKPDYVINLISVVTATRDLSLFSTLIETNLNTLLQFFECLKSVSHLKLFVQFGSAEEYGNINTPYREDAREQPDSPYALIKTLTTNTAMMFFRNYHFPVAVIRPGNLFGKYQPNDKLLPYLIGKLRKNEEINLTPGEQKRDFIYIKDFALAIKNILDSSNDIIGNILNVSYGRGVSIKSIVEYLRKMIDSQSIINLGSLPYRENEMMEFECDIGLLLGKTGTQFRYNVYTAIDDYLAETD